MKLKRKLTLLAIAGIVVMAAAAVSSAFSLGKYEKVKSTGGVVSIPVDKVSDGKAHFYKYDEGGKEIAFFVVKGPDGALKTAFDACDACYRDKKGYEQNGKVMVCKNCNRKFAINGIGPHEVGGCNPSYLPSRVSGGSVVISAADIKSGARFF